MPCPRCVMQRMLATHPVKAPAHGLVQGIGQIGGAQDQDARVVAVDALHLHQELRLDAARRLALAVPSAAAQRINLRSRNPYQALSHTTSCNAAALPEVPADVVNSAGGHPNSDRLWLVAMQGTNLARQGDLLKQEDVSTLKVCNSRVHP